MKRILVKLILILVFTCSCNSLKNKWELYHLEFGENIKPNTNQYGFVLKKDSMEKEEKNELLIKSITNTGKK